MNAAQRIRADTRTAELRAALFTPPSAWSLKMEYQRRTREWHTAKRITIWDRLGQPASYDYYKAEVDRYQRFEWMSDHPFPRAVYHAAMLRAETRGLKVLAEWRVRAVPLALALVKIEE